VERSRRCALVVKAVSGTSVFHLSFRFFLRPLFLSLSTRIRTLICIYFNSVRSLTTRLSELESEYSRLEGAVDVARGAAARSEERVSEKVGVNLSPERYAL
jgi:hypothetical protein